MQTENARPRKVEDRRAILLQSLHALFDNPAIRLRTMRFGGPVALRHRLTPVLPISENLYLSVNATNKPTSWINNGKALNNLAFFSRPRGGRNGCTLLAKGLARIGHPCRTGRREIRHFTAARKYGLFTAGLETYGHMTGTLKAGFA